jgi:putative ABC transport system substrate-binding protein
MTSVMDRRAFLGTLSGGLLAAPLAVGAQQAPGKVPRIGLLSVGSDPSRPLSPQWLAFLDGLRALGYVERQNIVTERRFAAGKSERVAGMANELVQLDVDVIVTTGLRETQGARQATRTIPIVMIVVDDPVDAGFVESLARPGGNITGLSFSASGIGGKYVELLGQAAPSAKRMGIVASRPQPAGLLNEMHSAARRMHIALLSPIVVRQAEEFESAFINARAERIGGVIFPNDALAVLHRQQVVELAATYRVPALYTQREFVEAGGLMTYGPSFVERFGRAATYVDKILKGAKPGDLPVEQPTKFDLVINLKTAKALGLTVPPSLLQRADQVIE